MIAVEDSSTEERPYRQTSRCAVCLTSAVGIVSLGILPSAYVWSGVQGLSLALSAALLCLLTGIGSLLLTQRFTGQQFALFGILSAMALRMVPPLVICLVIAVHNLGARWQPFIVSLLIYYLTVLGVETWLSVRFIHSAGRKVQGA